MSQPLDTPTTDFDSAPADSQDISVVTSQSMSTASSVTELGSPEPVATEKTAQPNAATKDFNFLPIPKYLRYDPDGPTKFDTFTNILFGVASTCMVANLYYCQPLLIDLAKSFGVTHEQVSRIPTLVQTGYAVGLLTISPLGDLIRRRPLILLLITISCALTIGLPITSNMVVFEVLSFLIGIVTVVPQILMPLAADLAPPHKRASALSIVFSGLLFGVLIARVLSGIIAEFSSWRVVYIVAIAFQACVLVLMFFKLPDYPAKNKGMSYFGILYGVAKYAVTEPLLIQSNLISLGSMACLTNFWVTLTFLLGGPIYNYNTLVIGLFGLAGMGGVAAAPLIGRGIDRVVPWFATVLATLASLAFYGIQLGAGGVSVAAVVIVTIGIDLFRQTQQVSVTTRVYGLDPAARSRMNAGMMIFIFLGQIIGTSVGTDVFNTYGWRASAALSVGFQGFCLFMILIRGPHVKRYTWFGYEGGYSIRKEVPQVEDKEKQTPQGGKEEEGKETCEKREQS
ncbi:MFS superfamily [Cytidiella melzeri]|nr:MFS superfamily [Cytidiella melzeri]